MWYTSLYIPTLSWVELQPFVRHILAAGSNNLIRESTLSNTALMGSPSFLKLSQGATTTSLLFTLFNKGILLTSFMGFAGKNGHALKATTWPISDNLLRVRGTCFSMALLVVALSASASSPSVMNSRFVYGLYEFQADNTKISAGSTLLMKSKIFRFVSLSQ